MSDVHAATDAPRPANPFMGLPADPKPPRPEPAQPGDLTPLQKAEAEEAKRTPLQRAESLVQEAQSRLITGGGFTTAFVAGLRAWLEHTRGSDKPAPDTATFDGTHWTVTRPGLHSVQVANQPGMTIEQAIAAAQPQLAAADRASTMGAAPAATDTAVLAGDHWTVSRTTAAGPVSVDVPAEPGMSVADAITAAAPKLAEAEKAAAEKAKAASNG